MADGTIGSAAVVGSTLYMDSYTHITIATGTGATIAGSLYKFDAYTNGVQDTYIKIFRDDGTNYLYIGGESFSLVSGLNSDVPFITPIDVKVGDFIAFYANDIYGIKISGSTNGMVNKSGNITSNSLKSGWATVSYKASILGYISPLSSGGIMNWWFMKEAWDRHKEIWTPKLLIPKGNYC